MWRKTTGTELLDTCLMQLCNPPSHHFFVPGRSKIGVVQHFRKVSTITAVTQGSRHCWWRHWGPPLGLLSFPLMQIVGKSLLMCFSFHCRQTSLRGVTNRNRQHTRRHPKRCLAIIGGRQHIHQAEYSSAGKRQALRLTAPRDERPRAACAQTSPVQLRGLLPRLLSWLTLP